MNHSLQVAVQGIGLIGPGLEGWQQAAPLLRGEQPYAPAPLPPLKPELLPPNERRRTTQLIKLAIQAAEEAQQQSGIDAAELACIFASAEGDTFIVDRLCEALTLPQKPVSPTQFHNSVHNAPAGYWAIAGKARRFSTSITAAGATFAAGLMEAAAFVATEGEPALLVAYDVALPESLAPFGDCHAPFATALVLSPVGEDSPIATLALEPPVADGTPAPLSDTFAALRRDNPAAEALVLLHQLAQGRSATLNLTYLDGSVLPMVLTC
jgi:hypothetical protein